MFTKVCFTCPVSETHLSLFANLSIASSVPVFFIYQCFLLPSSLQETDYIVSHFDNGEDYGFDDDDNMDEGVDF